MWQACAWCYQAAECLASDRQRLPWPGMLGYLPLVTSHLSPTRPHAAEQLAEMHSLRSEPGQVVSEQ